MLFPAVLRGMSERKSKALAVLLIFPASLILNSCNSAAAVAVVVFVAGEGLCRLLGVLVRRKNCTRRACHVVIPFNVYEDIIF